MKRLLTSLIILVLQQQSISTELIELPPPEATVIQDMDELLMILVADAEISCHVDDLYASLRRYDTFSDKDLARSAYLAETQPFRQWLQGLRARPLLVDGHCGNHMNRRASPMSVFCASLIQSLRNNSAQQQEQERGQQNRSDTDLVLYFFCGQHTYDEGPLAGPQGLIRSLTTQLILAWPQLMPPPDLQFLSSLVPGSVSSAQADLDVGTVCDIFAALLGQLPKTSTVHCIIDGLSCFETSIGNWSEDICEVVEVLSGCCSSRMCDGQWANFKLLLASADKSTVVRNLPVFSRNGIVELRAGEFYSSLLSPTALISDLQNQKSSPDVEVEVGENSDDEYTMVHGRERDWPGCWSNDDQ